MSTDIPQNENPEPGNQGGLGGTSGEIPAGAMVDPRTPGRDLKLIRAAVNRRWGIRQAAFDALPDSMLAVALDKNMDERARVGAAAVVVKMNGQNIEQDQHENPHLGMQVNVSIGPNITIVRQRDFYGNDAHDQLAEPLPAGTIAASVAGSEEPGAVQDADLRPAVGKNLNGANGHAGGARPDAGGQNGSH